jgi:hypothetical protein
MTDEHFLRQWVLQIFLSISHKNRFLWMANFIRSYKLQLSVIWSICGNIILDGDLQKPFPTFLRKNPNHVNISLYKVLSGLDASKMGPVEYGRSMITEWKKHIQNPWSEPFHNSYTFRQSWWDVTFNGQPYRCIYNRFQDVAEILEKTRFWTDTLGQLLEITCNLQTSSACALTWQWWNMTDELWYKYVPRPVFNIHWYLSDAAAANYEAAGFQEALKFIK